MQLPAIHRTPWSLAERRNSPQLLRREWLVTNGLGGYASGTVSGICTRRYHGLLVAALQSPFGRMMMFNHIAEEISLSNGTRAILSGEAPHDPNSPEAATLASFSLEFGLPVWRYELESHTLERRIVLLYRSNTVHLTYRLISGDTPVRLRLRPWLHFRPHNEPVDMQSVKPYTVLAAEGRYRNRVARLAAAANAAFRASRRAGARWRADWRKANTRSNASAATTIANRSGRPAISAPIYRPAIRSRLVASTESWETISAVAPAAAIASEVERRQRLLARPIRARNPASRPSWCWRPISSSSRPTTRVADAVRSHAAGDEIRSVIAGYHWFTDWGRDTMISLEGLTLRHRPADRGRLHPAHVRSLRPRRPDPQPVSRRRKSGPLSHGRRDAVVLPRPRSLSASDRRPIRRLRLLAADAERHHRASSARHAVRNRRRSRRRPAARRRNRLSAHLDGRQGGRLGRHAAPRQGGRDQRPVVQRPAADGRLAARRRKRPTAADEMARHAERAGESFNRRFWYAERGCLYDVVDGEKGDDRVDAAEPDLRDFAAPSGARRSALEAGARRGRCSDC